MIVNKKKFPKDIKDKITQSIKTRKVNILFNDGADILADNTNIRFIEPYKVLFTSKNKNPMRYLVALMFDGLKNKSHIAFNLLFLYKNIFINIY